MAPSQQKGTDSSFTLSKKIGAAKSHEIVTVMDFTEGYRNREDTSLLKPQNLVAGSHDVLVGNTGRVRSREGYYLDGIKSSTVSITRPLPDWEMGTGTVHHLRAGNLTSAGNDGKLQLRYVDAPGALGTSGKTYWLDLLTSLTSTYFQSTPYWDVSAVKAKDLLANRTGSIYEWTGAIGTIASVTASTIVLNGTLTLAQLMFDSSGFVINNGIAYQYDSISGQTFTLHSGTPSPVGSVINSPVYQQPVSYTFASATFTNSIVPPTGFTVDLIALLKNSNQVMLASVTNNLVYLSKAGTYKDYSQSSARLQYEGDTFTTVGPVRAFAPQENSVYVSAGLDEWYTTKFTETTLVSQGTSTTLTYENAELAQLKTTVGQASQSQYMTTKIVNDVVFVSNEPRVDSLGRVDDILLTPQITNLSYPIIADMNVYSFTDASLFYFKEKLYVAIPSSGIVIIYNMTNPKSPFWEAPQNLPLSGFCAVGNTLIGHSYNTFESYVMFSGYSDRAADANSTGNPINAVALFAFQELGLRAKSKSFNKFFVEGYITQPTTLNVGLIFRAPGNGITAGTTLPIIGTASYVINNVVDDSLGKFSLGKNSLATDVISPQQQNLPPYFAVIKTALRNPYLAYQPMFYSLGTNQRWELLSYGNNASPTYEGENDITQ